MPTPSEIQTCIDNLTTSSQPIDITLLAAETSSGGTGVSFSVPTVDDLPDLETNNIGVGQIVFVDSIGVPVVNTVNEWKGLDGRLLRKDFDVLRIFSWGNATCGQLGDGRTGIFICSTSPVREFCSAVNWTSVSAGCIHTAALKTSGEIWSWGRGLEGNLGNGTLGCSGSPVREICSATNWCHVSTGSCQTTAIKTNGELWTWGHNLCGQLGDGTVTRRISPVREICSATDWCQASIGGCFTASIKSSGELWTWGSNFLGRLGDGTTTNRCSPVREISSSTDWCSARTFSAHIAAIKNSGQIWTWGLNTFGNLGDGTTTDRCSPVREICSATDWSKVGAGSFQAASVKTNGEIWTWGRNFCGVLGDGTTTNRCSPVREFCSATNWCDVSGGTHTAAIKSSGEIWTWGRNVCGVLGDGTSTPRCSPVREISSATSWSQVSAGYGTTAAIDLS